MNCEVCGRTAEELETEFGIKADFEDHQGLTKCSKCIKEYERELGSDENAVSDDIDENADWKSKVVA